MEVGKLVEFFVFVVEIDDALNLEDQTSAR